MLPPFGILFLKLNPNIVAIVSVHDTIDSYVPLIHDYMNPTAVLATLTHACRQCMMTLEVLFPYFLVVSYFSRVKMENEETLGGGLNMPLILIYNVNAIYFYKIL